MPSLFASNDKRVGERWVHRVKPGQRITYNGESNARPKVNLGLMAEVMRVVLGGAGK